MNTTLPSVFLSHGSPMLALEPGETGAAWRTLATHIGKPKAILAVSAHWGTRDPIVSGAVSPETIHDFGGFPEPLYALQYPAHGAPEVAGDVVRLLAQAGIPAAIHPDRGLDHGAWAPLRFWYPDADVPVLQLSIQPRETPRHHWQLGQALAPLREQGILILASGGMTHNLWDWGRAQSDPSVLHYVETFQHWMQDALARGDTEALLDYRRQAPFAERAHPTDEHLLPLFVALGAGREATLHHDAITEGFLAMDLYSFH